MGALLSRQEMMDASDRGLGDRIRRIADTATTQARVVGIAVDERQWRRRSSVAAGASMGLAGLVGSVTVTVASGSAASSWWIVVPCWILSAMPIAALVLDGEDALASRRSRAAFTAEVARRLCSWLDMSALRTTEVVDIAAGLEPLTELVENDVKATTSLLQNPQRGMGMARRRHDRIVPRHRKVIVTTVDGRRLRATIGDLSLSGVAMTEALPRLAEGDRVRVGRQGATVVRCWPAGIAFQFDRELDPDMLTEEIVL